MSAINQLQMSYSPEEGRILLRLNTTSAEEFLAWLTRRYSQLMVQALSAHRASDPDVSNQVSPLARKAVESFKREAADSGGNFRDGFKPSGIFPLGKTPVLAHKLSYRVSENKLELNISPESGQGVKIALDTPLNFNITKLLKSAAEAGSWVLDWGGEKEGGEQISENERRITN